MSRRRMPWHKSFRGRSGRETWSSPSVPAISGRLGILSLPLSGKQFPLLNGERVRVRGRGVAMAATWREFLREKGRAPAMDERRRGDILRLLHGRAIFDAPMREYTSFRVGGPADCLASPAAMDDLKGLLLYLR